MVGPHQMDIECDRRPAHQEQQREHSAVVQELVGVVIDSARANKANDWTSPAVGMGAEGLQSGRDASAPNSRVRGTLSQFFALDLG